MNMQIKTKEQETKLIVVTRADLSIGYQAQQSTHSVADFAIAYPDLHLEWNKESGSIICLSVNSEEELLNIHQKLHRSDVKSVIFQEPDLNNEYTSLCYYADYQSRKLVSHLPLLGKEKSMRPIVEPTVANTHAI